MQVLKFKNNLSLKPLSLTLILIFFYVGKVVFPRNDLTLRIREAYLTHVRTRLSRLLVRKAGASEFHAGASTVRTARLIEATSRRAIIGPINLPRVTTRGATLHARGRSRFRARLRAAVSHVAQRRRMSFCVHHVFTD